MTRWGPDCGDPTTYLTIALSTNSNNYGKWKNSEYDQLVNQVGVESDVEKRWQEMKDAEKILLDVKRIFLFLKKELLLYKI